jgi:hypothetical protein
MIPCLGLFSVRVRRACKKISSDYAPSSKRGAIPELCFPRSLCRNLMKIILLAAE